MTPVSRSPRSLAAVRPARLAPRGLTPARLTLILLAAFVEIAPGMRLPGGGQQACHAQSAANPASAFSAESALPKDSTSASAVSPQAALTDALRRDIQFLASDRLRGRSVTDASIDVARDYVRDRMSAIGLGLEAVDGRAFQRVEIPVGSEVRSREGNVCRVRVGGELTIDAQLGDGFSPLAVGKDRADVAGPVVFAGFGISSEEHAYDDYASIDADGSIVMVLRKEPGASDPDSPFAGVENTPHAYFQTKVANAIAHGAVGVLIVNDPESTRRAVQQEQNRIDQEQRRKRALGEQLAALPREAVKNREVTVERIDAIERLIESMQAARRAAERGVLGISEAGRQSKQTAEIPVASIARDLADRILRLSGGEGLADVEKAIDATYQPASRRIDSVTASLAVDLKPAIAVSDNVIGRLPGRGELAEEAIVVGAHYDHVGMGGFASLAPGTIAVHNGADDNASGTAALLGCAAELRRRLGDVESHRTVLMIAFTGEERGLVGSRCYVDQPVFPIERTAAMINLDMVGRLSDNELTVYGTGSGLEFGSLVRAANTEFAFDLFPIASGYGPSDHQSFYRAGVPVLFFFTGLHDDYHRPSDDFDKIDFGNLTRVTDMVSEVAFRLAVMPERPTYAETETRVQIRRQMTAHLGIRISQRNGGVTVTEVTVGGPASQAGLRPGDRIRRVGGQRVRRNGDLLSWLRARSAGDEFELRVVREHRLMTLRGKLGKRPDE